MILKYSRNFVILSSCRKFSLVISDFWISISVAKNSNIIFILKQNGNSNDCNKWQKVWENI